MTTTTTTLETTRAPFARTALLAGGGLTLAGIGLAAGLWMHAPAPADAPQAVAAPQALVAPQGLAAPQAVAEAPAVAKTERHARARKPVPSESGNGRTTPLDTQTAAASTCASCGVVEAVRSFERRGEGSGLGAVAGGVLGGALGNQVGKGNGRTAMTVIGAVGGGMAGHEIEKRAKSETLYEVKVRMEDGSLRTLTQKSAPAQGSRVVVDGNTLRSAEGTGAGGEPRMMRASSHGA